MSTTHITPTIGRIVYFRGKDGEIRPAIVTAVHGQFCINLYVFPNSTNDHSIFGSYDSVTHADPEHEPNCIPSWHWMPYQKQQAEKHATETKTYADGTKATGPAPLPDVSPSGAPALQPHQQRVVDEKAELDGKLSKLSAFFSTTTFEGLLADEQDRLRSQRIAMIAYSDILGERIAAFAPAHHPV